MTSLWWTTLLVTVGFIAGPAWGCVPQAHVVSLVPRSSGPAGGEVTVQGVGFDPSPSTTEIRWNTTEGPRLATSNQPDFSVPVTIPAEPAGLYSLLVFSRGADGTIGNASRAAFLITGGEPATAAAAKQSPASAPEAVGERSRNSVTTTTIVGGAALFGLGALVASMTRRRSVPTSDGLAG